ncbi:type II toxin-antitoxin system HicB family antitoxin [Bacillus thuringiensis]|uniref:type II toxin-antitoxin system HicB family antitoxin n=1 Tax=Bacillus thuringiensis TaxID=1428 RepID=UPI000ACC4668|nr:type II toxin-antitoxin system HicB family antitoxin [Bacillus thuringiensis]
MLSLIIQEIVIKTNYEKDYYVYPAILEKSSDGYGIYFPDLPGCVSHADTQEDALKEGREALGLHLYGMEKG